MRARLLVAAFVVALGGAAHAHGRDPYVVSIQFRPGHPSDVLAGTTIGLLTSHDGGGAWRWTCEEAVHYRDPFDPDYAYAPSGAIFAQTFVGLGVDAGTCAFTQTSLGKLAISAVTTTAQGVTYVAASDTGDSSIYKSLDDTVFTAVASPGMPGDWWRSLEVAPSDPDRVYLAGYRYTGTTKTFLVFVSRDGGATFDAIDTSSFTTTSDSLIEIVGIGADPDVVYARVTNTHLGGGTAIYRSANAGGTWLHIFESEDPYGIAWLARQNGELIAATRTSGAFRSMDAGATWTALPDPPHISALVEAPDGSVWAGTQSYRFMPPIASLPAVPSDGYAIMKSTDLATWAPVLRLSDLTGVACPTGTDIYEQCAGTNLGLGTAWCCLVSTLSITSTEIDCTGPRSCGATGADVTEIITPPPDGCCQGTSRSGPIWLLVFLIGSAYAYRPRRGIWLGTRRDRSRERS